MQGTTSQYQLCKFNTNSTKQIIKADILEIKQEVIEYLFGSNNALMIQKRYGLVRIVILCYLFVTQCLSQKDGLILIPPH